MIDLCMPDMSGNVTKFILEVAKGIGYFAFYNRTHSEVTGFE